MFTGAEIPEIINIHLCSGRLQVKFTGQKGKFFTGSPQVQGLLSQKLSAKEKKILTLIFTSHLLEFPEAEKTACTCTTKRQGQILNK